MFCGSEVVARVVCPIWRSRWRAPRVPGPAGTLPCVPPSRISLAAERIVRFRLELRDLQVERDQVEYRLVVNDIVTLRDRQVRREGLNETRGLVGRALIEV